jgi:hypothetical protein
MIQKCAPTLSTQVILLCMYYCVCRIRYAHCDCNILYNIVIAQMHMHYAMHMKCDKKTEGRASLRV